MNRFDVARLMARLTAEAVVTHNDLLAHAAEVRAAGFPVSALQLERAARYAQGSIGYLDAKRIAS
jgi:hypothetical protein